MTSRRCWLLVGAGLALALAGCTGAEESSEDETAGVPPTVTDADERNATEGGQDGQGQAESGAAPGEAGTRDQDADDAPFRVLSAERRPGSCLFADAGEGSCHTLRVAIDNADGKRDFSNNMFYWSAVSADGQIFSAPGAEGPDAVAAGHTGEVTLEFDVDGDATLASLRYEEMFSGETVTAPIPEYS